MTTPEELAQVIADAESDHLGIKRQTRAFGDAEHDVYIRAASAVLAHLGDGREECPSCVAWSEEVDDLRARLDVAIVQMRDYVAVQEDRNRWCEKVGALQAEARAQAAAHAEDVRKIQVRMLELEEALQDIARRCPPPDVLDALDDDRMLGRRVAGPLSPYITIADVRRIRALLAEADGR